MPAATCELAQVASTWPDARVFEGGAATGQAFADNGRTATIAHLAVQVPAHVVLSACELSQATRTAGRGVARPDQRAVQLGARCVVSGVAEVADDLAGEVMVADHRRMATGSDTAVALADATAAAGRPMPFVCFGAAVTFERPA